MRKLAKKPTPSSSIDDTASSTHRLLPQPPIALLPDDILARILGSQGRDLPLKEWVDYALVNRSWYSTMKQLVAAEFWVSSRSNLQQLEKTKVTVGSIRVLPTTQPNLASALEKVLTGKKVNTSSLTTLLIETPCFSLKPKHFAAWLPRLTCLRTLSISFNTREAIERFVAAAPAGLTSLSVQLRGGEKASDRAPAMCCVQVFAQLTQLEVLNINAQCGHRSWGRELVAAHRKNLFRLLEKVKAVQGSSMRVQHLTENSSKDSKQKSADRPCAMKTRASKKQAAQQESDAERLAKVSREEEADDADTQEEGASRKCSEADNEPDCSMQTAASPRVAAVSALAEEALKRAAAMKLADVHNSSMTDCIHTAVQALQWQLGLAQVMDEEEPCCKRHNVAAVEDAWQQAELDSGWLDLRPLTRLTSLQIYGHPSVWLPPNLATLDVNSWGYTGPLPPRMTHYQALLRASSSLTHWDLRPIGLLPLSQLTLSVECCEERRNREFCFQALQGSHSLQLYRRLQELTLYTDRSLHVDARISHSLLSLLAQRGRLRQVVIGSGSYRLQGSGDFLGGRGVAALNLLSDLQDHCGWHVQQQPGVLDVRLCSYIQRTVCEPPKEWHYELPNHPPDFISDFE